MSERGERWHSGDELPTAARRALELRVSRGDSTRMARGEQAALIYDSPVTNTKQTFTYGRLLSEVQLLGAMLRDFAIVATPNHLHFPVAKAFLSVGTHVICDKPLAFSVAEAQSFVDLVERGAPLFALTHNYTGYPLVRHARDLVRQGALGDLRKVLVEYNQDWLMDRVEQGGNKQAGWRTDPKRAGISCCVGDIGTHAANLLEFIAGKPIQSVCADLSTFVAGRELDDDANILLRLEGGATSTPSSSSRIGPSSHTRNIEVQLTRLRARL